MYPSVFGQTPIPWPQRLDIGLGRRLPVVVRVMYRKLIKRRFLRVDLLRGTGSRTKIARRRWQLLLRVSLLAPDFGLMGFGWSAEERNNWIVPTVFFGVISFGCSLASTTAVTFVVDSYRIYAGEALVTLNFCKSKWTPSVLKQKKLIARRCSSWVYLFVVLSTLARVQRC